MRRYALLLIPLFYCVLWCVSSGCNRTVRHDSRLTEIERLSEQYSDSATAAAVHNLGLINRQALNESDQRYYDFLQVKTADKAYITHTSDSLILSVIDYAASHRRDLNYPEALYYGGRVYSDIGDYPTALRYFQQALDEMPESDDRKTLEFKANLLSQTAGLLNDLRLYGHAISYIEKSIVIDSLLNDSVGMMYDLGQLGGVYRRARNYDKAEINFKMAYGIAAKLSHQNRYTYLAQIGGIKYHQGKLDSVLFFLRPGLKYLHTIDTIYVMTCAARTYLKLDVLDTALAYAKTLIWSKDSYNKGIGYEVIMNEKLIKFIPEDSLSVYLAGHRDLIEKELEHNESRDALIQNSVYNYHIHERARIKSEIVKNRLQKVVLLVIISVAGLIILLLYQKNRNKKNLLRLREALDKLSALRWSLHYDTATNFNTDTDRKQVTEMSPVTDEPEKPSHGFEVMIASGDLSETEQLKLLKDQLRTELISLASESTPSISVSSAILSSSAYAELQEYLERDMPVPETSLLWKQLEDAISGASEHFRYRINLLTGGKLKAGDDHTIMLLKCGFTPTQISKLLGRAKSSIGSKRESLSLKLFGEKLSLRTVDKLIRLL